MKIEKINENQIRCTLSIYDLMERHINIFELAYGTDSLRQLFGDMMQQAFADFGFEADDSPLMIEAIPMPEGSIIVLITKVDEADELDTRFSRFAPSIFDDQPFFDEEDLKSLDGASEAEGYEQTAPEIPVRTTCSFRFNDIDSVCEVCALIAGTYSGNSSLYRDPENNVYYLTVDGSECDNVSFAVTLNTLSEFGSRLRFAYASEAHFAEHYECIVDGYAIQVLAGI